MSATETHSVASWGQSLSGAGVCATEGWARWRGGASRKLERTGRRQLESWCGHLNNVALVPEVDGIARWTADSAGQCATPVEPDGCGPRQRVVEDGTRQGNGRQAGRNASSARGPISRCRLRSTEA